MRHPEHLLAQPAWSRSESPQSRQASNPGPSADGSFSDVVLPLLTLSRGSGNLLGPAHPVPDNGRLACLDKTVPLLRFAAPTAMASSTVFLRWWTPQTSTPSRSQQETVACRRSNTRSS